MFITVIAQSFADESAHVARKDSEVLIKLTPKLPNACNSSCKFFQGDSPSLISLPNIVRSVWLSCSSWRGSEVAEVSEAQLTNAFVSIRHNRLCTCHSPLEMLKRLFRLGLWEEFSFAWATSVEISGTSNLEGPFMLNMVSWG